MRGSSSLTVLAALLAGGCMHTPVQAQEQFGFLVVRSAKDPNAYWIWAAECKDLNVAASKQDKVVCSLVRTECRAEKAGDCSSIQAKSTDLPPLPLVFGVTTTNPTCGWVWDPYRRAYIYKQC